MTCAASMVRFWYLRMVASSISAKERDWTRYFFERSFSSLFSSDTLSASIGERAGVRCRILLLHFRQKLVGQNRNVRLLQAGGVKDVYDLVRRNGTRNDLPDCQKESDLVANLQS